MIKYKETMILEVHDVYEIGDYIVKSNDGVCRVDNILHLNIPGVDKNTLYYLLIPIDEQSRKIYIPVNTSEEAIRKTMSAEEARTLIDRITEIEEIWIDNEKLREQQYKNAVRSYNPEALIGVIKATYSRNNQRLVQGKKTTSLDERYFKMAEHHLYSELGFAINKDENEIYQIILEHINSKSTESCTDKA